MCKCESIDNPYHGDVDMDEITEQPAVCDTCTNLLEGDTLYRMSGWDGGIGFDYIRNIQFCPICGRKLSKD